MSTKPMNRLFFALVLVLSCSSIIVAVNPISGEPSDRGLSIVGSDSQPDTAPGRQGFLLILEMRQGQIRLAAVSEIDNYVENKHLAAPDDWIVLLLDGADNCLVTLRIGNPGHYFPAPPPDQAIPLTVKIPRLAGMTSIALLNQYREAQLRIPADDAFKAEAAARRRQFLNHDRENRRLLAQPAMMREPGVTRSIFSGSADPRLEDLPEDLRRALREEIALGMERMEEFGAEAAALSEELGIGPEEIRRQLNLESPHPAVAEAGLPGFPAGTPYTLSGQVTDADTGAPVAGVVLSFLQYDSASRYVGNLGSRTTDAGGNYSIGVDAGNIWVVPVYTAVTTRRYASLGTMIPIEKDTVANIKALPGILLGGVVTDEKGKGIGGVYVYSYLTSAGSIQSVATAADGRYSLVVPANLVLQVYVIPPMPYVRPPSDNRAIFTADTVRNYQLESGWIVSGTVTGTGGAAISGALVILRQLAPTTTAAPNTSVNTNASGKYTLLASKSKIPNSFTISSYASGYLLRAESLQVRADTLCDFRLEKGFTVSGTVRDASENPISGARVRAYRDGSFVVSALTGSAGTYSFDLLAGVYEFEALPPVANARKSAPAKLKNVEVSGMRSLDFVLPAAAGILNVTLYFPDQATYSRYSAPGFIRFELSQFGRTMLAGNGIQGAGGLDRERQKYYRPVGIYLDNGTYDLLVFPMGCAPIRVPRVEVKGQVDISVDLPSPFLWSGILRGADKRPLAGLYVQSYNDLTNAVQTVSTGASGDFSILLTPNGFAKFYTDAGSNNILHTERFGVVNAGRNDDVILDQFPAFADSGAVLTQIFGDTDRRARWNIVMIGDGYTGVAETYTDSNSNGQWDGVLYYDLNKNGVWDTGEPYQRYGNATAPTAGADPTRSNEAFTDLNGDGAPNLHDQELFDRNTLDTARSLFGQDEWRKHREAFNIFRIRLVSRQAGHKIYDRDGKIVVDRDTALGSDLNTPDRSYLFRTNYTLAAQYINQYVPECDTRIVLVNQPIRMGRANSYILTYGGEIPSLGSDYVIAHEMGHNVGLLADEYTEYQETYRGNESNSANITALSDPALIPWRSFIAAGKEIPSVAGSAGVGLYEGAGYYTGGRYRPTEYCMMVSGNRYCPVCTGEIEIRLRDITGTVPDAVPRMPAQTSSSLYPEFTWDAITGVSHYLFELQNANGELVASYDIYGTSFTMPFALTAGADYRWRIRPASNANWGAWTGWISFKAQAAAQVFSGMFAQVAAGGGYQTGLTAINLGQSTANISVSLNKSDGTALDASGGPAILNVKPMGTARLDVTAAGATVSGFARVLSNTAISGTALFKTMANGLIVSEAGVGFSKAAKRFTIYVDNLNDALSGYAIANAGTSAANLVLTLRDSAGAALDTKNLSIAGGQHKAEFANSRFAAASPGFEGSVEFVSDQEVGAVALRYDNAAKDVFSTIPVLGDDAASLIYFPQVADGGGYRTNFILVNPSASDTTAKAEFFSNDGTPLPLMVAGSLKTSQDVALKARGVIRFFTDGTSVDLKSGWVKVTSPTAISGSAIFQTLSGRRILSEAGVGASPAGQHLIAYMESLGSTQSGIAVCNPSASSVTLALNLRNSSGEIAATAAEVLPANGHLAKFFTEWFPRGFNEFEGTLEIVATGPVSAVALRYDNPQLNVFATLPVIVAP